MHEARLLKENRSRVEKRGCGNLPQRFRARVPQRQGGGTVDAGLKRVIAGLRGVLALFALSAAVACVDARNEGKARDSARDSMRELPARIAAILARPDAHVHGESLREAAAVTRFYAQRAHQPAWLEPNGAAGKGAGELARAVSEAVRHGLHPDDYHAAVLSRLLGDSADECAALELLHTDAFLHLARHLAGGAVDPRSIHPGYERAAAAPPTPESALAAAVGTGEIASTLARLAPPHPEYVALVAALDRLRAARAAGDATAATRADQVRANLERWRWLPRELGRRHLRVNTPDASLRAFDAGAAVLAMRVVVGKSSWKTPLAHGAISHLVLNPAWNVPHSIATREMLPTARRDPGYFIRTGIQVLRDDAKKTPELVNPRRVDWKAIEPGAFPFRLRQPPGPFNPLGRIKFVFANPYGVYLHGTPGDLAFARALRALSHGCVRVEDELALAAFALAPDPAWTRERLLEVLRNAWEHRLPLPEPLRVHLLYFTASVAADGTLSLAGDPYGWDRELIAALGSESDPR
jgi:murein L,D-transpeptidase YcbB/YkuD